MDLKDCTFQQYGEDSVLVKGSRLEPAERYQVKLEGAMQVAYRTFVIAGIRDPLMICRLEEIEGEVERQTREYYRDVEDSRYKINFYNYGINGVMG